MKQQLSHRRSRGAASSQLSSNPRNLAKSVVLTQNGTKNNPLLTEPSPLPLPPGSTAISNRNSLHLVCTTEEVRTQRIEHQTNDESDENQQRVGGGDAMTSQFDATHSQHDLSQHIMQHQQSIRIVHHDVDSLEEQHDCGTLVIRDIPSHLLLQQQAHPDEDEENLLDLALQKLHSFTQSGELPYTLLKRVIQELHDREVTAEYEKRERMVARVLEMQRENEELMKQIQHFNNRPSPLSNRSLIMNLGTAQQQQDNNAFSFDQPNSQVSFQQYFTQQQLANRKPSASSDGEGLDLHPLNGGSLTLSSSPPLLNPQLFLQSPYLDQEHIQQHQIQPRIDEDYCPENYRSESIHQGVYQQVLNEQDNNGEENCTFSDDEEELYDGHPEVVLETNDEMHHLSAEQQKRSIFQSVGSVALLKSSGSMQRIAQRVGPSPYVEYGQQSALKNASMKYLEAYKQVAVPDKSIIIDDKIALKSRNSTIRNSQSASLMLSLPSLQNQHHILQSTTIQSHTTVKKEQPALEEIIPSMMFEQTGSVTIFDAFNQTQQVQRQHQFMTNNQQIIQIIGDKKQQYRTSVPTETLKRQQPRGQESPRFL
ncbi:hypothetical protein FGO68_gene14323 [Halteria grandinella]|uniref:Uncharacterized protein n=1 Tax=Halteria grandinella TaxID=5974 RepID=A0A8J8NRR2_HALGN|nr:hypothetical protein FGO68_gene14323 [Halteria grandinella]